MRSKCTESESCYNGGCRSEACRLAASEGRRERRRLAREAVGEPDVVDTDRTPLVSIPDCGASTGGNSVVEAVSLEISDVGGHPRPGLAAAALSLAALLDNPRATSSKPAAAGALVNILNQLRKSAGGSKPKLAAVRQMTKAKNGQA
jgi:hypothetical protein